MINELQKIIWDKLLGFPLWLSSGIFYSVIYILCMTAWHILSRYIFRLIEWGYCAAADCVIGNANNYLYQKTKKTLFFKIDEVLYQRVYRVERRMKENTGLKWEKYGILAGSVFFCVILLWNWMAAGGEQSAWEESFNPLHVYIQREERAEMKFGIASREVREKERREEANLAVETEVEPIKIYYKLSKDGWAGAKIRMTPEKNDTLPLVTIVAEEAQLEGLGEEQVDNEGITWVKVRTEDGKEGWISKKLVVESGQ